jgi:DNA-binding NarL/FixJ family response regulator
MRAGADGRSVMPVAEAMRVLLAEDNLLVREGVRSLLATRSDIEVTGVCATFEELLAAVDEDPPVVVVTDIRMPPSDTDEGIRAARRLRATHPDVGVVVLSQFVEASYALALLEEGSARRGYVLKHRLDDVDRLVDAVMTVAAGGSYIDTEVVDALVRGRTRLVDSPLSQLTAREREILAAVAAGRSNAAIAGLHGISVHAVEKHINSIFVKLGLRDDGDTHRRVKAVLLYLADPPR